MSVGDKLKPISESFTLKDHTFTLLRAAILDMDIYGPEADLRLDERKLAESLGISTHTDTRSLGTSGARRSGADRPS